MARRPTLTQAQLDALRADYEAWNPYDQGSISADELAAKHRVSKNTMYTWRSRGWRLDGREGAGEMGWKHRGGDSELGDRGELSELSRYLTEELVKARIEIDQLKRQLEEARRANPDRPAAVAGPRLN